MQPGCHPLQELRVFSTSVADSNLAGVLQFEPHTTVRMLRMMCQAELGFECDNEEDLFLQISDT